MKVLFMGDSITHLNVWVKYFNEIIKPEHHINIAVSGSRWCDFVDTVYDGEPVWRQEDGGGPNNTICNQVEKVLRAKDETHPLYKRDEAYDGFDVIFVSAGSNDAIHEKLPTADEINTQFINNGQTTLPLEKVDRKTFAGSMRYTYEHLRRLYPNAKIFYCSPVQAAENIRTFASIKLKGQLIKAICDRISDVVFVDTFNCGICGIYEEWNKNGRDLIDGLHPNDNGGKKIAEYNARAVKLQFI